MFAVTTTSGYSINPEEERNPPPPPTQIYFPQNDLDAHSFHSTEDWIRHIPNLFEEYAHIAKPTDIKLEHLRALNVSFEEDVELDQLIPVDSSGHDYLPPAAPHGGSSRKPSPTRRPSTPTKAKRQGQKHPLLSNGHQAPDLDEYLKHLKELTCESDDAFRVLGNRKARPGHPAPRISRFRRFWGALELMSCYWDSSLDHYYDVEPESADKPRSKSPKGLRRFSQALSSITHVDRAHPVGRRYKGRRMAAGSKMPEQYRQDCIRAFVQPLAWAFGCVILNPRKTPQMEIGRLRLPVTQTAIVWRNSQDKAQSKKGITEGPLLGLQARNETGFVNDQAVAALDVAREIAGLLLLAEERSREGKAPRVPGDGEWWTATPRWGGGSGGDFGDKEENTDQAPPQGSMVPPSERHVAAPTIRYTIGGRTEEQIWKDLSPGASLWDPHHAYLAVGKDRSQPFDSVFMVTSIFHHIAILKLTVHPLYMDFLVSGSAPENTPPDVCWYKPKIQRTRWYDLFLPDDRAEAMRGLWGVMSYLMRSGDNVHSSQLLGRRQKSDSHQHHFSFRRKSTDSQSGDSAPRSSSVAF